MISHPWLIFQNMAIVELHSKSKYFLKYPLALACTVLVFYIDILPAKIICVTQRGRIKKNNPNVKDISTTIGLKGLGFYTLRVKPKS